MVWAFLAPLLRVYRIDLGLGTKGLGSLMVMASRFCRDCLGMVGNVGISRGLFVSNLLVLISVPSSWTCQYGCQHATIRTSKNCGVPSQGLFGGLLQKPHF